VFRITDALFDQTNPATLGLSPIDGDHTLLYKASDNDYRFCHHPSLSVFNDRIYCCWSNGVTGEDEPTQRILISSSADGKSWSEPSVLVSSDEENAAFVASGFLATEQSLVCYFSTTYGDNFHEDVHLSTVSSSDGMVWSEPTRIASGFFIEGPRPLADGRLLLGGEHVGSRRSTDGLRMRLLYSDEADGLSGWKEASIAPATPDDFQYTEPNMAIRPDGVSAIGFRSQVGYLFASTSDDNGETWSTPEKTNFPDSTSRFFLRRLPNGQTIMINNPSATQYDRSVLALSSSDDGITFDRSVALRNDPATQDFGGKHKVDGWQYPNALVWNETLVVAYSINKEDIALTRIAMDSLPR
jgi:predicted neuraminidase